MQSINLKPRQPIKLMYAPYGRTIAILSKSGTLTFLELKAREDGKEEWMLSPRLLKIGDKPNDPEVECTLWSFFYGLTVFGQVELGSCVWDHQGTGIIVGEKSGILAYYSYPELKRGSNTGAHSGGATCVALDPRGK